MLSWYKFTKSVLHSQLKSVMDYVLLSYDLSYIDIETYNNMNMSIEEVSRLLNAYYRGIKERNYL